jgi:hypothetical protein
MQEKSTKKKVIGKPIEKGQVLNPHGRPKKEASITHIMNTFLDELELGEDKINGKKAVVQKIFQLAMQGDLPALKYICDRIDGTPIAAVKQVDDEGKAVVTNNINITKLSKEEKDLLANIAVKNMGLDE